MPTDAELISLAARTIEDAFIGVLATVDEQDRPDCRHMAAVAADETLHYLFSLTATETRKVHEVRDHAEVCWLFASEKYERVVRLMGQASFGNTNDLPMSAWNRLVDYANAYVTPDLRDKEHYAFYAMTTRVDALEFLCPEMGLITPHTVKINH